MELVDGEQLYRGEKAAKRRDSYPVITWSPVVHCPSPSRYVLLATFGLLAMIFVLVGCVVLLVISTGSNPLYYESIYNSAYSKSRNDDQIPLQTSSQADVESNVEAEEELIHPDVGSTGPSLGCNERAAILKVYMYDLPPQFHYGMLIPEADYPKGDVWPRRVPPYPGGLYAQHSPEYWLTTDVLTSTSPNRESICTAYRVNDWRLADVVFVPFFASLSYNREVRSSSRGIKRNVKVRDRNRELQENLVAFLEVQPAWRASRGFDHVVVMHHPNSLHVVRERLRNVMFVVADFGRYAPEYANLGKDIIAPYKHVVSDFRNDFTSFESRKTLLYFQGAIHRKEGGIIRQQLYKLLKDEPGVHFESGNTTTAAIQSAAKGMQGSKFCLNLAGDTPSSNRLFDAIASHCVPVIVSDEIELPFEDDLDYSKFCLFVRSEDALRTGFVINLLRGVGSEEWTDMWRRLREVDHRFKYQHPARPDDAVHLTWKAIARKVSKPRLLLHKQRRYIRSKASLN